jgi:hypothetical protein
LGVALAATLFWLFFLRGTGSGLPPAAQTPVATTPAAGRSISFDEYKSALDTALSQVQRASAAEGESRKEAIEAARAELEGVEGARVSAPNSDAPAVVDNASLIEALKGDDPDLARIEHSLSALLAGLDAAGSDTGPGGVLTGDEAAGELREVLEDPVFNYEREPSPLQRLARWLASLTGEADPENTLWRWLLSLVAGLAIGALTFLALERVVPNRWVRLLLAIVAGLLGALLFNLASQAVNLTIQILGVVGLVVAVIASALILLGLQRGASAPPTPRKMSDLASVLGMGAGEARRRAAESGASGDYRAAIRYRCLAVLLALDEANMLHFDRAATNREYLFRAPGDLQGELQPLLAQFDTVWYGNAGVTEAEWRDYDARASRLEAKLMARSGVKRAA